MKEKVNHPEWALKHKKTGTELRLIKGRYYLYEVSSKWNKEKKRAQKITGKILGRITEDKGFCSSESSIQASPSQKNLSVKTSGIGLFVESVIKEVLPALKKHFGDEAEPLYPNLPENYT